MLNITRYIVSVVDNDRDGQCDGKPRILCSDCKTPDEAKAFIENDMKEFIDNHTDNYGNCEMIADFNKMQIRSTDYKDCSEWQFEEITIELTGSEIKNIAATLKDVE